MAVAIYQKLNNGMKTRNHLDWLSMGFRPFWHFSRYFSLVGEIGLDYSRQEGLESGTLGKFTIAPQLSPLNRLLSRPALRAYFTWAVWSDEYVGMIAPHSFPDRNNGISVGIQMETWW
jgi:maltoporin